MKTRDPLLSWNLPQSILTWSDKVDPRPERPWLDYINYNVHPDIILSAGRLLAPAFIEHEGGVFLSDNFISECYSSWMEKLGNVVEVEKIMNHRHVYDMFSVTDEISDTAYAAVAGLMADGLRMALQFSFPDRNFKIYVSNSD